MKKKKLSKLIEKGIVRVCDECKGSGKTYGHGAFGESESYTCSRCRGEKYILDMRNIEVTNA